MLEEAKKLTSGVGKSKETRGKCVRQLRGGVHNTIMFKNQGQGGKDTIRIGLGVGGGKRGKYELIWGGGYIC